MQQATIRKWSNTLETHFKPVEEGIRNFHTFLLEKKEGVVTTLAHAGHREGTPGTSVHFNKDAVEALQPPTTHRPRNEISLTKLKELWEVQQKVSTAAPIQYAETYQESLERQREDLEKASKDPLLGSMKVAELKEELKRLGLANEGKKAELIVRLQVYYRSVTALRL